MSSSGFATETEPRYAVTESTMTGPKGTISLTQIGLIGWFAAQAACDGQLEADRNTKGPAIISSQRCVADLPPRLATALERKPLADAYVFFVENSLLFFRAKSMHVVKYHFDPGPAEEVCARLLSGYRKLDPNASCIPPATNK